jgi:hypothetical protein
MSSRLYGDHFIMAFPSFDTATNGWVPQADISWNHKSPSRKFAFIRFASRCKTEAEAISAALDMAQAWIDQHLRRLHGHAITPDRRQVIDVAEFLKESLAKVAPKQARQARSAPQKKHSEQSFTFGQFKSAIAEKGLHINDEALHKSYAALVKLRQHRHLSWAEARRKVEQSQQNLRSTQSSMRWPKTAGVPLTERDWRRIG